MPACDMCSATTSWEEGTGYTAAEFRKMVSMGLGPAETMLSLYEAMGTPRAQGIAQWKNGLVATSTTGWLLCPACASRAGRYLPKAAGGGPAGHVLTESVAVEKLFPGAPSYAARASAGRAESRVSAPLRVALLASGALWLALLLFARGGAPWLAGLQLATAVVAAVLAYQVAQRLNRSPVGWGLLGLIFPVPSLFVLPFLRAK